MTVGEIIGAAGVLVQAGIWMRLGRFGQAIEDLGLRLTRIEDWRDRQ